MERGARINEKSLRDAALTWTRMAGEVVDGVYSLCGLAAAVGVQPGLAFAGQALTVAATDYGTGSVTGI